MKLLFITRKWLPAFGGMEVYCAELTREIASPVGGGRTIADIFDG